MIVLDYRCVAPVIPSCRAHLNVPYGREDRANISQETGTMHYRFQLFDDGENLENIRRVGSAVCRPAVRGLHKYCCTVWMSLSPRPERQTITISELRVLGISLGK